MKLRGEREGLGAAVLGARGRLDGRARRDERHRGVVDLATVGVADVDDEDAARADGERTAERGDAHLKVAARRPVEPGFSLDRDRMGAGEIEGAAHEDAALRDDFDLLARILRSPRGLGDAVAAGRAGPERLSVALDGQVAGRGDLLDAEEAGQGHEANGDAGGCDARGPVDPDAERWTRRAGTEQDRRGERDRDGRDPEHRHAFDHHGPKRSARGRRLPFASAPFIRYVAPDGREERDAQEAQGRWLRPWHLG